MHSFIFLNNAYRCTYLIYLQKYLGIGIATNFYMAKLCQLNYLCLTKRQNMVFMAQGGEWDTKNE